MSSNKTDISKINIYPRITGFSNKYELMKKLITLFAVTENLINEEKKMRPRLIEILAYYILEGYSSETKQMIKDTIPSMTSTNLNQINHELQDLGYLVKNTWKEHDRDVAPKLLQLKKYVDDTVNGVPLFVVKFMKNAE